MLSKWMLHVYAVAVIGFSAGDTDCTTVACNSPPCEVSYSDQIFLGQIDPRFILQDVFYGISDHSVSAA